jgi:hypothetical protein
MELLLKLLPIGILFIPGAGLVAWIVSMENERFLQKIDQETANEIRKRCSLDESPLMPAITHIRHSCKKENRYLFLITFLASLISFFGGAVAVLRQPW